MVRSGFESRLLQSHARKRAVFAALAFLAATSSISASKVPPGVGIEELCTVHPRTWPKPCDLEILQDLECLQPGKQSKLQRSDQTLVLSADLGQVIAQNARHTSQACDPTHVQEVENRARLQDEELQHNVRQVDRGGLLVIEVIPSEIDHHAELCVFLIGAAVHSKIDHSPSRSASVGVLVGSIIGPGTLTHVSK